MSLERVGKAVVLERLADSATGLAAQVYKKYDDCWNDTDTIFTCRFL